MRSGRTTRRQKILLGLLVALLLFSAATIRLFLLPATDAPRHVDAIVVFGGSGARVGRAERLLQQGYASTLAMSYGAMPTCPSLPGIRVLCFRPAPFTTQGEARYLGAAARKYGWKSVIVVTTTEQDTRARIRVKRCTGIRVAYLTTAEAPAKVVYSLFYEWAALFKAEVLQRSC